MATTTTFYRTTYVVEFFIKTTSVANWRPICGPSGGKMPLGAGGVKDNGNGKDGELDDNAEKYFNQFEHSYI